MIQLLVDIGNTHLDWALEQDGEFHYGGQCASRRDALATLCTTRLGKLSPERVVVANVADPELGEMLAAYAQETWDVAVEILVSRQQAGGINIAYAQPETLGVDRLATMVAAFALVEGAVCVAGCGTAITIDLVDSTGQHQGGLVLPGYQLMQQSLLEKSAHIKAAYTPGGMPETTRFGRTTGECVQQGSLLAATAVIERAHTLAELQLGGPVQLVLTGGDGTMLLEQLSVPARFEAHLVLKGLGLMARSGELELKL